MSHLLYGAVSKAFWKIHSSINES